MPISEAIAEFSGKFEAAKAELANVQTKIGELEQQRHIVVKAPPHTDDIVAVFMRGLLGASQDFTTQFASRLNDTFVGEGSAEAAAKSRFRNILTLEAKKPDQQELMTRSMRGDEPDLNLTILTYFLREQIAAEIPVLVDKLCPAARSGMKRADREARLKDIDTELARLRGEANALRADLEAARAALR